MREYLMLSKLLLKMQFKKDKQKKGSRANMIAMIALGAYFAVVIAVVMIIFGKYIGEYDFVAETGATIMLLGFMLVLIFGITSVLSYMYFSPDNEFLMSMPVRPSVIYAAKLTSIYAMNVLFSTLLILPGLLFLGISSGQGFLFFIMIPVAVVLVPVLPLLLASLLAIPLMYVTSFFRRKGLITTILLIVIFAGAMTAYMVFSFGGLSSSSTETEFDIAAVVAMIKDMLAGTSVIIYPLLSFARFMTMTSGLSDNLALSMLIDGGIFFGTLAVLAAIVFIFSAAFYRKSTLRQTENPIINIKGKREHVQSSAYSALLKKEWKELIRNPSFAFQCLMSVVICPLFAAGMSFMLGGVMFEDMDATLSIDFYYMMSWILPLFFVQMFGIGMNLFSMTAITREGKTYEVSKIIPVPYDIQLKAKKTLGMIISFTSVTISLIIMEIAQIYNGNYNPVLFIGTAIMFCIYNYGFNCYLINRDLKNPKLDWSTPAEAVKNNTRTIVPVLINTGVVMIVAVIIIIFSAIGEAAGSAIIATAIGFIPLIGGSVLFSFFMHRALNRNTEVYYNRLGDN